MIRQSTLDKWKAIEIDELSCALENGKRLALGRCPKVFPTASC